MRGTSLAILQCRMAVMRPEATPTRPSPAKVFVVNLLSTCHCTAMFAIYHVALGFRKPEPIRLAMGKARQGKQAPRIQISVLGSHTERSVEDDDMCDGGLEAATRE